MYKIFIGGSNAGDTVFNVNTVVRLQNTECVILLTESDPAAHHKREPSRCKVDFQSFALHLYLVYAYVYVCV